MFNVWYFTFRFFDQRGKPKRELDLKRIGDGFLSVVIFVYVMFVLGRYTLG